MSHAKNQHYVARLYLRRFAYETGKNPHINAFDKTTGRSLQPSIGSIASKLYFYESTDTGIERLLGRVESAFTPVYQRLREATSVDAIEADDRVVVALFLAAQLVRTQEYREQIKSITSQVEQWAKKYGHNLDPSFTTITEDGCREIQASAIVNRVPEFAQVMAEMKWILLRNQTAMPLWTSDHPINFYNPRTSDVRGTLGLECQGIQVYFPLSPTLTLCLCDPVDYAALPGDAKITGIENVIFQNNLQLRESTRFLFSSSNDFALAHDILSQFPDLGDPSRLRLQAAGLDEA